jgi:hypothetical protein
MCDRTDIFFGYSGFIHEILFIVALYTRNNFLNISLQYTIIIYNLTLQVTIEPLERYNHDNLVHMTNSARSQKFGEP